MRRNRDQSAVSSAPSALRRAAEGTQHSSGDEDSICRIGHDRWSMSYPARGVGQSSTSGCVPRGRRYTWCRGYWRRRQLDLAREACQTKVFDRFSDKLHSTMGEM
jgi:hypothetical protein